MAKQRRSNEKIFLILIIAGMLIAGFSSFSFAEWGEGHGYHMQKRACYGGQGQMSKKEFKEFEKQRAEFFNETKDIRRELRKNHALMRAELASKEPDTAKLQTIQKEISTLKAELDQKRLVHIIEMKKSNPAFECPCPYGGYGMGCGAGRYHMGGKW